MLKKIDPIYSIINSILFRTKLKQSNIDICEDNNPVLLKAVKVETIDISHTFKGYGYAAIRCISGIKIVAIKSSIVDHEIVIEDIQLLHSYSNYDRISDITLLDISTDYEGEHLVVDFMYKYEDEYRRNIDITRLELIENNIVNTPKLILNIDSSDTAEFFRRSCSIINNSGSVVLVGYRYQGEDYRVMIFYTDERCNPPKIPKEGHISKDMLDEMSIKDIDNSVLTDFSIKQLSYIYKKLYR